MQKDYTQVAIAYAEKYGILEWTIKGNKMVYYRNYHYERNTYKIVVNLDTQKEESRTRLQRYYKKGYRNAWV